MLNLPSINKVLFLTWCSEINLSHHTSRPRSVVPWRSFFTFLKTMVQNSFFPGKYRALVAGEIKKSWFSCVKWGAHPCWWDSWWDSHLVRWLNSWWDDRTLGEMAGLLVIFLDSWWDLRTLGDMLEMLVKLIITKIITFNTDSGYDTKIKKNLVIMMLMS